MCNIVFLIYIAVGTEAFAVPCGPEPEATKSLSWGQTGEESMVGVREIFNNVSCSGQAVFWCKIWNKGQINPYIFSMVLTTHLYDFVQKNWSVFW